MKDIVDRSSQLGVKTKAKKYSEFDDEQKFIGFVWNGQTKTVRLPLGKRDKRIAQISPFLVPGATFTFHNAMVLAGRLNHTTYVVPQLWCHLQSVYQWQKEWVNTSASRPAPPEMQEDLKQWTEMLNAYKLIPDPDPTDVGWVGDASTSYGVGVLIGKRWGKFHLTKPPPQTQTGNIVAWLETIAVRMGLLMLVSLLL
jgi:hypothetical protein